MRCGSAPRRSRTFTTFILHRTTVRLNRADLYLGETEAACLSLADFPERGTRRDDLRPGLRTLGFRRQATIVFRIREDGVGIGRILYRGRDLTALASSDEG